MKKSMNKPAVEASKKFGHENLINGVEKVYAHLLRQKKGRI
jgi:hypothetical protein